MKNEKYETIKSAASLDETVIFRALLPLLKYRRELAQYIISHPDTQSMDYFDYNTELIKKVLAL